MSGHKYDKMIIYKVDHNLKKGIKEFEILSINNDGTFNCESQCRRNKILVKNFSSNKTSKMNQPSFFITKDEAMSFLSDKLNEKIKLCKKEIESCFAVLNAL